MIEIIYKEDQKQAEGNEKFFRIPNNIRQIGEIRGQQKIYIEDYAYTFLKKISRIPEEGGKAAVLLGQYHWAEGNAYLFIKSALQIRNMEVSPEHIVFSDKVWGQVYEDSRKYFPQQEIVGWFVSLPGFNMQINEVLLKTHLNHFAGNDKVLFVAEPGEWEEAFFVYENNQLNRQPGYYIYYEKNEPMQAYMIEMSQNKSIEETEKVPDRAVLDFRKAVKQNHEKKDISKNRKTNKMADRETGKDVVGKENQRNSRMVWTLGGCTVAAALALGITFFNSYQNMSETLGILENGQETEQQEEIAKEASAQTAETTEINDEPLISMQDMNPQKKADEENNTEDARTETETETDTTGGQDVSQENAESDAADQNPDGENEQAEMTEQSSSETDASAAMMTEGQTAGGDEYIIQKGDTLTSISKRYYGTIAKVEEICRLNGISPEDIIYAGQKLVLPE
ncbi:LysM peptidoglycan-binding domain-containing protein [bacterium]|nr:LysM peptidoglycan-binding domain-containing protein [bacterium]MDY3021851.1 LysM domain-containing protein [Oliverpabstia sp.]